MPGFFQPPLNFMGLPEDLSDPKRARGWVLPIPYEATTSYGAGTRDGPAAILAASRQVEWFDREFDSDACAEYGIHTLNSLAPVHVSPEHMIQAIEAAVTEVLSRAPGPDVLCVLGGEHSISPGVVRGLARVHGARDLVCVHVDAHADLRDEYEGSPFSHACAARRILETCPIYQIGIRNLSEREERFRSGSKRVRTVFAAEAVDPGGRFLADLGRFVRGKTVFFTIDLDGLDPSIMPAVGTPEPGGLSWARMLEVARVVCGKARRVPVFDVVELAPIPAMHSPDFLAATLVYKIFSLLLAGRTAKRPKHR